MTFEEYIMDAKRFIGELSPIQLNELKSAYQRYLLQIEDADYLEPIKDFQSKLKSDEYLKLVDSIFDPLNLETSELCVLVLPSGGNEYQLKFKSDRIEFIRSQTQIWSQFYNNEVIEGKKQTIFFKTSKVIENDFVEKIITKIKQARNQNSKTATLDGIENYFIFRQDDKFLIAFRNSDKNENSEVGSLLKIMNGLIN